MMLLGMLTLTMNVYANTVSNETPTEKCGEGKCGGETTTKCGTGKCGGGK